VRKIDVPDCMRAERDIPRGFRNCAVGSQRLLRVSIVQAVVPEIDVGHHTLYDTAAGASPFFSLTCAPGRGPGLDVVRRIVQAPRGKVAIHREHGRGFHVTITLPLMVALIRDLRGIIRPSANQQAA
jgi:hypothetical protein